MRRIPYFNNFWISNMPGAALSPRFPLRIAFTTFLFLLFTALVWVLLPRPDIPGSWFYSLGGVAYMALVWSNEAIYRYAKAYQMLDLAWYRKLAYPLVTPLLISVAFYHVTIFPMHLAPEELDELSFQIAARYWSYVHFPVLIAFSVTVFLFGKAVKPRETGEEINEMLATFEKYAVEMEDFRKQFSDESLITGIGEVLPLGWKVGVEEYLSIAPDAFERPFHSISNAYFFQVLPPYCFRTMVARMNALVKTGDITICDVPDFKDGTYVEMAYKSRKVRFRHPEAVLSMNEMMSKLSELLMPDYQLRHCRLLSEPDHMYQWMVCLQPAQWKELIVDYGLKKINQYFGPVDRNYRAGPHPDRKMKDKALALFKMDMKLGDSLPSQPLMP